MPCKAFLFLFVGLHHPLHFDFGKSKKKKKITSLRKCEQNMTKIVPYVVFEKQKSFKMFKLNQRHIICPFQLKFTIFLLYKSFQ